MQVRYTYRLRPGRQALSMLAGEDDCCRWVWNQCVELDRAARATARAKGGKPVYLMGGELHRLLTGWRTERDWLAAGSVVAQQQTIRDFCKARRDGIRIRKRGGRRGHPRFRSKRRSLPTLNYTLRGFSFATSAANGRTVLKLAGGIVLPVVWSRLLPSAPSSVRVYRDTLGHWWASFVVERTVEPLPKTGQSVGIDWGVTQTATASDPAFDLEHAEHGKREARALARYQRRMARRKPKPGQAASNGYRKAKRDAAKVHRQVADRRNDDAAKWALSVVRGNGRIADEDFKPKWLASGRMARKAADARIASARQALAWAAKKHGREHVLVAPAYTTMDCGACGARAKHRGACGARAKHRLPLSQRTYQCESCGYQADRDRNAADVILLRAGFDPAAVDRVRPEAPREPLAA